jgi:hypothetical protein
MSDHPSPSEDAELDEDQPAPESDSATDSEAEPEPEPTNRAARRAKGKAATGLARDRASGRTGPALPMAQGRRVNPVRRPG